jgi:hypothetical protein
MWMKYKHKWNSGIDKEWTWVQLSKREDCTLEEAGKLANQELDEATQSSIYDYYGGYRGQEREIVKLPPLDVVANRIFQQRKLIKYHHELMQYYTELHNTMTRVPSDET